MDSLEEVGASAMVDAEIFTPTKANRSTKIGCTFWIRIATVSLATIHSATESQGSYLISATKSVRFS